MPSNQSCILSLGPQRVDPYSFSLSPRTRTHARMHARSLSLYLFPFFISLSLSRTLSHTPKVSFKAMFRKRPCKAESHHKQIQNKLAGSISKPLQRFKGRLSGVHCKATGPRVSQRKLFLQEGLRKPPRRPFCDLVFITREALKDHF